MRSLISYLGKFHFNEMAFAAAFSVWFRGKLLNFNPFKRNSKLNPTQQLSVTSVFATLVHTKKSIQQLEMQENGSKKSA